MENPWRDLPVDGPYFISKSDEPIVRHYNRISAKSYIFHPELIPEPFIGNKDAPVVALNANPGYDPADNPVHSNPLTRKIMCDSLVHNYQGFYYLSDQFIGSKGRVWWMKKLNSLILHSGLDDVFRNLLVIEAMAYHSEKFKFVNLPSQEYSCFLVRMAISRNALIIVMRSKKIWFSLVPELNYYNNLVIMKNCQQPYFSPGNLPNFDDVVKRVRT